MRFRKTFWLSNVSRRSSSKETCTFFVQAVMSFDSWKYPAPSDNAAPTLNHDKL